MDIEEAQRAAASKRPALKAAVQRRNATAKEDDVLDVIEVAGNDST